jgi:hypothetical protein
MIAVSRSAGCVPGSSAQTIASLQRRCRQLRGGLTAGNSSWGAAFNDPDYVKIVWTLRADPVDATHSVFRTETRVVATDPEARRNFRKYWSFLSPGIIVIRWMYCSGTSEIIGTKGYRIISHAWLALATSSANASALPDTFEKSDTKDLSKSSHGDRRFALPVARAAPGCELCVRPPNHCTRRRITSYTVATSIGRGVLMAVRRPPQSVDHSTGDRPNSPIGSASHPPVRGTAQRPRGRCSRMRATAWPTCASSHDWLSTRPPMSPSAHPRQSSVRVRPSTTSITGEPAS